MWPLISRWRISSAAASASSGVSANFTPPAFMRPPVSTCDLITTGTFTSAAIRLASSAVVAKPPPATGMPSRRRISRASYSKNLMRRGSLLTRESTWLADRPEAERLGLPVPLALALELGLLRQHAGVAGGVDGRPPERERDGRPPAKPLAGLGRQLDLHLGAAAEPAGRLAARDPRAAQALAELALDLGTQSDCGCLVAGHAHGDEAPLQDLLQGGSGELEPDARSGLVSVRTGDDRGRRGVRRRRSTGLCSGH